MTGRAVPAATDARLSRVRIDSGNMQATANCAEDALFIVHCFGLFRVYTSHNSIYDVLICTFYIPSRLDGANDDLVIFDKQITNADAETFL